MLLILVFIFILVLKRYIATKSRLFFIVLFFSILIGFRGNEVGADTENYLTMYERIGSFGYVGYPEPLFGYMILFSNHIGLHFSIFLWLTSFITLTLIYKIIIKYSDDWGFSVFVLYGCYFVFYMMNITRQLLAVSLVLYGYHFLYCRKTIRFIICVLLASLCHYSAIISLIVLFVRPIRFNRKLAIISILALFVFGILVPESKIISVVGPYAHYLVDSTNGFRTAENVVAGIILMGFWSSLAIIVCFIIHDKYLNNIFFKIYILGLFLNNLLVQTVLGLRIVLFFSIVQVIILPNLIHNNNLIKHKKLSQVILVAYIIIFFAVFTYNNSAGIFPYYCAFNI